VGRCHDNGIWSWRRMNLLYNYFVNKYVEKSPFHIVYGRSPKGILDLVKLLNLEDKRRVDASEFAESI